MLKSIIHPLQAFINSIVNLGVESKESTAGNFIVQIVNVVGVLVIVSVLVSLFASGLGESWLFYVPILFFVLVNLIGLYLNSIGLYLLAKICVVILTPCIQFFNVLFIDVASIGIEMTIIPMAMVAPIIFKQRWLKITLSVFLLLLFTLVVVSRDYPVGGVFIYNLAIIIIAMLVGVTLMIKYLQETAEELRANNIKLIDQNKNLEQLVSQNNLKTELLGFLSHDLKGPAAAFNKISKKVSFLLKQERFKELEELGDYFEVAGDKIYYDIDRLLNWTIAQKKDIIIRIEEVAPQIEVNRIIEGLRYHVRDLGVSFLNNVPKNVCMSTDNHILHIILKNLMTNAANHSSVSKEVIIDYRESENYHIISINNKGSAIDMDIVKQAKKGRYRKSKAGHGLGLGICFSLIKFLFGEIEFHSSDIDGTTVNVKLPKEV